MDPGAAEHRITHGVWSSRFADAAVEERYLAWAFGRIQTTAAQLNLVTIALLSVVATVLVVIAPPGLPVLLAGLAIIGAASLVIGRGLARRDWPLAMRAAIVGNLTSAFFAALLGHTLAPIAGGGFAVAVGVFTCQFVTGTARERPGVAIASGLITVSLVELSRLLAWRDGEVGLAGLAAESTLLWASYAVAVAMARRGDADARVTFAQEELIREQHAALARERARTEELLHRELAHQVAARSRDLGVLLASSGDALDVRSLAASEQLADRYRVIAPLGSGAMGAVYEVERVTDGGHFALKLIAGEVTGRGAARFAREAEIGARVRHENLVAIVDVGISHGAPYLVMELVRGRTLEQERRRFGELRWILPLLEQIASGLAALHDAGVVHRDLKPANVLLAEGPSGVRAKVSDYGIASFRDGPAPSVDPVAATAIQGAADRSPALTATGVMLGTPLYMAPEAARGGREVSAAADVFALGIVAYETLTGKLPFAVPPVMMAMAEEGLPDPPPIRVDGVSEDLEGLVTAALRAEPERRPSTQEMVAAFRRACADLGGLAIPRSSDLR